MDATNIDRIVACIGKDGFNKLVMHVRETVERGKLRFWQQQFLERLHDEVGVSVDSIAAYTEMFGSVMPIPTGRPISRSEFLASKTASFTMDVDPRIHHEWIATKWDVDSDYRNETVDYLDHEIEKLGDLEAHILTLKRLAKALPDSRIVELYIELRDRHPSQEAAIRPQFEVALEAQAAQLPRLRTKQEIASRIGDDVASELGIWSDDRIPTETK